MRGLVSLLDPACVQMAAEKREPGPLSILYVLEFFAEAKGKT
jgi:hypothetical protein